MEPGLGAGVRLGGSQLCVSLLAARHLWMRDVRNAGRIEWERVCVCAYHGNQFTSLMNLRSLFAVATSQCLNVGLLHYGAPSLWLELTWLDGWLTGRRFRVLFWAGVREGWQVGVCGGFVGARLGVSFYCVRLRALTAIASCDVCEYVSLTFVV